MGGDRERGVLDNLASIAPIAATIGTFIIALIAYFQLKLAREIRIAQERPHVIVDADYSDRNVIDVVVRNIGRGAAKNISFDFSADMVHRLLRQNSWVCPVFTDSLP